MPFTQCPFVHNLNELTPCSLVRCDCNKHHFPTVQAAVELKFPRWGFEQTTERDREDTEKSSALPFNSITKLCPCNISLANAKSLFKIHFGHLNFICWSIFKMFAVLLGQTKIKIFHLKLTFLSSSTQNFSAKKKTSSEVSF